MDREAARENIRARLKEYVERVTERSSRAGGNMYVCPLCGSGNGSHGTGAFSIAGNKWKCFSCGKGGDIFDLIGELEHTADYNQQLQSAAAVFNITIDSGRTSAKQDFSPIRPIEGFTTDYSKAAVPSTEQQEQPQDYSAFIAQSARNIERTDYHRGITLDTLHRFNVGYCSEWRNPMIVAKKKAEGKPLPPATPRLIVPTSSESYLARDTRADIPQEQRNYDKQKVGKLHIFNYSALYAAAQPIYVVEGEIDALSIIDVGGEAIGLGSTVMVGQFLSLLEKKAPIQPLIIAMDNDNSGKEAVPKLINGIKNSDGTLKHKGLQALEIPFFRCNISGHYKDANEALQADRAAFIAAVKQGVTECIEHQTAAAQEEKERYLATSAAAYIQKFIDGIADSVNTPYIPTGFSQLDNVFDGGLYEGLYIVGAISSLGKTTLITQIADQIAQSGTDVLIFSLEMARTEIMSKSISRHTLQSVLSSGGDIRNAKTARGITTGKKYERYSLTERELINNAIRSYGEYADRIYISEGIGDIGAAEIRAAVQKHISFTGNTPVVVIDYLQILAPADVRATDKQNTDKAVMELKRISRDFKLPILGISSFNRENYSNAVTMAAFKESGAIEYSSDVLIGLQLKGAGEKGFDATEAKKKNPREIELVILKNRNGRAGDTINFSYYPMFNYFKEEQGA